MRPTAVILHDDSCAGWGCTAVRICVVLDPTVTHCCQAPCYAVSCCKQNIAKPEDTHIQRGSNAHFERRSVVVEAVRQRHRLDHQLLWAQQPQDLRSRLADRSVACDREEKHAKCVSMRCIQQRSFELLL